VDDLLTQLSSKFSNLSSELIAKSELGHRANFMLDTDWDLTR